MKIVIIGGSGFIGGYLQDIIIDASITNLDKNAPRNHIDYYRKADVRDIEELRSKLEPSDCMVLLAAEHQDNVSPTSLYYDVNVDGTKNVLRVAKEKGINKIIFTSSVAVYGLNKDCPDEKSPVDPFNHYGITKYKAEEILREWYHEDPLNRTLIIIRPTVVFGPGNRGNVYNLLNQISSGKFLMIGNGQNRKSMAYVENVAAFIRFCIDSQMSGYRLFNYVDKPDLTTRELLSIAERSLGKKVLPMRIPYALGLAGASLLDLVSKLTGKKFPVSTVRIKKFCATTQYSAEKAVSLAFQPPFTLEKGLSVTIDSIMREQRQERKAHR